MAHVVIEARDAGVVEIRIDRPPVNAFNLALARDLETVWREAIAQAPRALVLSAAGRCFSGGIDIKEVPGYTPAQQQEMVGTINRMVDAIYSAGLPVVCAVTGHIVGGALCVALACDYRVCTTAPCRLSLPEVEVDIPYPAGPLRVVQAELAPHVARRLVMANHACDPRQALAWGVVDELVEPDQVVDRAAAVAATLASLGGYARVKAQFRAPAAATLREIVETGRDPMLTGWLRT